MHEHSVKAVLAPAQAAPFGRRLERLLNRLLLRPQV